MTQGRNQKPADMGSLKREVVTDLLLLQMFLEGRDRALVGLFGRRLARSHLRDELIRQCALQFGQGQTHPISYYQDICAKLGSRSGVRDEIARLEKLGVFVVLADPGDRRVRHVWPTQRLVDWYADQMPSLMQTVQALFARRQAE